MTSIGIVCVVLGGLISAMTGPLELAHGSWTAAYLVLVGGVTQCAMGQFRTYHPDGAQPRSWAWAQVGTWNLGNALVIAGTLASATVMVDLGSVLLVAALAIALHATRSSTTSARLACHRQRGWVQRGYRILLLVPALSIPVGIVLSHIRH